MSKQRHVGVWLAGLVVLIASGAAWYKLNAPAPERKNSISRKDEEQKRSAKDKKTKDKKAKDKKAKNAEAARPPIPFRSVPAGAGPLDCPECNVILISIDTLRADHLGAYGYSRPTSPNLDELAGESLLFEEAIAQSSWTAPSHAAMLSGLLPRDNGHMFHPRGDPDLPKDTLTLAEHLARAGYQTASWNGGGHVRKSMSRGFKTWKSLSRRFPKNLAAAREWLHKHGDKPFFLFLHSYDPHTPYIVSGDKFYKAKREYDAKEYCTDGRTTHEVSDDELQYFIARYDAAIEVADKNVGTFLQFLRKQRLLENTIVIITSDHGEEFLEHGRCNHVYGVYRELLHVPLIVHLPSKLQKRVSPQVAAAVSLKPTVLGMLGLGEGEDLSLDLRRVVEGGPAHDAIISETAELEVKYVKGDDRSKDKLSFRTYKAALTTPDAKLIFNREGSHDTWELYGKEKPPETTDLSKRKAAQMTPLKKRLFPPTGKPSVPPIPGVTEAPDAETMKTLRALGYVQ